MKPTHLSLCLVTRWRSLSALAVRKLTGRSGARSLRRVQRSQEATTACKSGPSGTGTTSARQARLDEGPVEPDAAVGDERMGAEPLGHAVRSIEDRQVPKAGQKRVNVFKVDPPVLLEHPTDLEAQSIVPALDSTAPQDRPASPDDRNR
nr:hypothetical protein DWF04_23045 [Cereibacter sphaeroides f. sp. denitrificans]